MATQLSRDRGTQQLLTGAQIGDLDWDHDCAETCCMVDTRPEHVSTAHPPPLSLAIAASTNLLTLTSAAASPVHATYAQ